MSVDPERRLLQLQAAQDPIQQFVTNRLDQLMQQLDVPVEMTEQVWEIYISGMQDGNLRIGELL